MDNGLVSRLAVVETDRRRRWSDAEKLRIVAARMAGPRLVSATARRHGISRWQLNSWRRQVRERRLVDDLHAWLTADRARLSRHAPAAKAMDDMLTRWARVTTVLEDGRICLTNNAAERPLRGVALGRTAGALRRLRTRRRQGGVRVNRDRHGKDRRSRPAGLARRRPRPHRRHPHDPLRRTSPVELGSAAPTRQGCLTAARTGWVPGKLMTYENAERPHSTLDGRTPFEAHTVDRGPERAA